MVDRRLARLVSSPRMANVVTRLPGAEGVLARFGPAPSRDDLLATCAALIADGFFVTVDLRLPPSHDEDSAEAASQDCLELLDALYQHGLARQAEIAVAPSALGQGLADIGAKVGLDHASRVAGAARTVGAQLLLDLADHRDVEPGLELLRELRKDFPEVGVGVAANLRRTEDDCRALAFEGSRVRLGKGHRLAPAPIAFADRHEADKSYVRCLKLLLAGQGMPVVATGDPRLVRIAGALATRFDRQRGSYEYQLRHGVRREDQQRLHAAGDRVRIRLTWVRDGSDNLVRRLARRGPDLTSFLRSKLPQR